MPPLHGPFPPLQHVALLFLWLQNTAEASAQTFHYFPAVLWTHRICEHTHSQTCRSHFPGGQPHKISPEVDGNVYINLRLLLRFTPAASSVSSVHHSWPSLKMGEESSTGLWSEGVQGSGDCFNLMVPFTKLAYLSNLSLHNNHFLTEIRMAKSPANREIKMIFHHKLIQIAVYFSREYSRKAGQTAETEGFVNTKNIAFFCGL